MKKYSWPQQMADVRLLTLVRGCYCYSLCCELVVEVARVRFRRDLGLEGRDELREDAQYRSFTGCLKCDLFCRRATHLLFENILPVDGGEELVAHHVFGVVWSTSEPARRKQCHHCSRVLPIWK